MNTLRRLTRHMVKAVAAGAVLVAAGLPVAIAGTAGAATSPTLYCSQTAPTLTVNYNFAGSPFCGSMPYGSQNSVITVNLSGSGLAFNGGSATATTTATGVTVLSTTENNANSATVTLAIGASATPGYYPITLTDASGSATLTNAFGVDPAGTVTSTSPTTVAEGATTLITVTGTGLNTGSVSNDLANLGTGFNVVGSTYNAGPPASYSGTGVANGTNTSLTFYVSASSSTALGTYPVDITGVTSTNSAGNPGVDITVTGASISSVYPSRLDHNTTSTSVTQTITISGSGFVAGANVQMAFNSGTLTNLPYTPFTGPTSNTNALPELVFGSATVVNSTTITVPVTIQTLNGGTAANTTLGQFDVQVTNPNGTSYLAGGAIGWLEAGNAAYSTPTVTMVTNGLVPGTSSYVTLRGNPAFPLSTGDVVTLTSGRFSFPGKIVSVDSTGLATAKVYLPQDLSTTLTSAVVANATNLPVASLDGIIPGTTTLTFVDATADSTAVSGVNSVTSTVQVPALLDAHAAGTPVEFPIQQVSGWTLSVNNGATTIPVAGLSIGATPAPHMTYMRTDGTSPATFPTMQLAPGTYTMLYTDPGANFASTGASVTFANSTPANPDTITGTITPTSADTAWITVKMPTSSATPAYTNETTIAAATSLGQTSLPVTATTNLAAGATYRLNNGGLNAENVTISPTWNGVDNPVPLTAPMAFAHASTEQVALITYPVSSGMSYYATINTGNGQLLTSSTAFATTHAPNVVLSGTYAFANPLTYVAGSPAGSPGLVIGAGATNVPVSIFGDFTGASSTATDYVVSSTTPGVTFSSVKHVVTGASGYVTALMSVAKGTAVNASVQVTVTELNGQATASVPTAANPNSGLLIGNTPTVTAVTGIPASMQPGETATFTVTGTLFDASTSAVFLADTGNLAGAPDTGSVLGYGSSATGGLDGVTSSCSTVSSTTLSCTVSIAGGATNGAHDLVVTNGSHGSAVFANALTVANASIGAISPTIYQQVGSTPETFTLSGLSGFANVQAALGGPTPSAEITTYDVYGNIADQASVPTTWAGANAVTVQVGSMTRPPGGVMTITLNQNSSVTGTALSVDAPLISLGLPLVVSATGFGQPAGTTGAFSIGALTSGLGSPFGGLTTFQPGAKVSVVPVTNALGVSLTSGISVSGVTVLPGLITGSLTFSSSTPAGNYQLEVVNPDGGVAFSSFSVTPAPLVTAVNGTAVISGPVSFLSGTKTTLTIAGANLQTGAVVSASVAGDATFGATTVNSAGTVLSVPVTFTSFTGATPVVLDLTVTNADGGMTTVTGEIILNPQPTVTGGPYYVPTFTTNKQLVVTGTGFEAGMTVASSNADYTVSVANVTPTAATLLVSTNSNATSGTNTTLTFTNPDGGTTTMTLNGGPVPKPAIKAVKVVSAVWTGKTTTTHIIGSGFYGQPKITSNVGGTKVSVSGDSGTVLTIHVAVAKTSPRGVHTFTLQFKNGEVVRVKYNQR
jgi:hypothetical protein